MDKDKNLYSTLGLPQTADQTDGRTAGKTDVQTAGQIVGEIEERIAYMLSNPSKSDNGGSRWSYLKSVNRLSKLARYNPKHHKGIPQCQEVVQYRPQLLKLFSLWGTDNPKVMVHTVNHLTGEGTLELSGIKALADDAAEIELSSHDRAMMNLIDFDGEKMPVALCIGGDPVYRVVADSSIPSDIDPYFFAGLVGNKAVKVVRCLTQELLVPDDCDYVIEGYLSKNEISTNQYPIVHITGITHKKGVSSPYHPSSPTKNGDTYIPLNELAALKERIILQFLRHATDRDITDLYLPPYGNGTALAVIKIKRRYQCHAAKVAHAVWGSNQLMLNKVLIIVDENTKDIRSGEQLLDAIGSNYSPKLRTLFSRGPADISDSSTPVKGFGGKICIDATSTPTPTTTKTSTQTTATPTTATPTTATIATTTITTTPSTQATAIPQTPTAVARPARESDENENNLSGSIAAIKFIHRGDKMPSDARIIAVLPKEADTDDMAVCLHRLMAKADPIRDSSYVGNQLVIDIS